MVVELGSHTDCRNTKKYNQKLSEKRAKSSADYIKHKIYKPERVYGRGYGETKLVNSCACEKRVVSNCSEEDHQMNRRTEFIIKKK
jgi:outer membrane protein OmpA-like peptidoglycan-associated protein